MDVIKSRYGKDRSIEKLGDRRIRIMGESEKTLCSKNDKGVVTMFDFEGGPCYNVGGTIKHQKTTWKIKQIIVEKGSISINGISLTVAKVENNTFMISIIDHTFHHTNLKFLQKSDQVNIEFDYLARFSMKNISS